MEKKLDCIQMKKQIQEKMLKETESLNTSERIEFYRKALNQNSRFASFINKVPRLKIKESVS